MDEDLHKDKSKYLWKGPNNTKQGLPLTPNTPPYFYISRIEINAALYAAGQEVPTNNDIVCNDTSMAPSSLVHEVPSIINAHSSAQNMSIPMPLDPVVPPAQGAETNGETQTQGKCSDDYSTFIRNNMYLQDISNHDI